MRKIEELLSDRSKFVKTEFNSKHTVNQDVRHLLETELEIKSCSDDFLNKNYLSKDDWKYLKPCRSKPGIMYGLCEIHKCTTVNDPVPPFRTILSAIGACNYNLAKSFVPILKQFTINEYTVKDSFSFYKDILDQDSNLLMASFKIYPWMKRLIFELIWFFVKRRKLKACLSNISNNYLHFLWILFSF